MTMEFMLDDDLLDDIGRRLAGVPGIVAIARGGKSREWHPHGRLTLRHLDEPSRVRSGLSANESDLSGRE